MGHGGITRDGKRPDLPRSQTRLPGQLPSQIINIAENRLMEFSKPSRAGGKVNPA